MKHTLVNPNQICYYVITVQNISFTDAPIFISMEDYEFSLIFVSKVEVLRASNRTPTNRRLQTFPHIILFSEH